MNTLVWFRNDLRVHDQPALASAMKSGKPVIALTCLCPLQWRRHDMGDARLAFTLRALQSLSDALDNLNIPLKVIQVEDFQAIPDALSRACETLQVSSVHFVAEYPLNERRRDAALTRVLAEQNVSCHAYTGDVVVAPDRLYTKQGKPYTVFTPYFRQWYPIARTQADQCVGVPQIQAPLAVRRDPVPTSLDGVEAQLLADLWPASEDEAHMRLNRFLGDAVLDYPVQRDVPAVKGTSGLSAYLSAGLISARYCVSAAWRMGSSDASVSKSVDKWVSEIAWRDFYRQIVAHFDHISRGEDFRPTGPDAWRQDAEQLTAWQEGRTGYPLVDAGMRQLNSEGWMHNRVRMVVAMFLTKHLLLDWREGQRYFMHKLVDGDFASNNGGWQWSASTGTDAAPYFRIFNPQSQAKKFDGQEHYVQRYVPELQARDLFSTPGGQAYPDPIVDHKAARERALAFFKAKR